MGVAADDHVDVGVEVRDDVGDGAGEAGAALMLVVGERDVLRAALVEQHDDGVDALAPSARGVAG